MTDEEMEILRVAFLTIEEIANETISDYLEESCIPDQGKELVQRVAEAIAERYRELCAGEADQLLATWRRRGSVN